MKIDKKYELIVIWHAGFRDNKIFDPNPGITGAFLNQNFPTRVVIRNTLQKGGVCRVSFYKNNIEEFVTVFEWIKYLPNVVRYFIEPSIIGYYLVMYGKNKRVLAVDPLSALVPCLFRKMRYIKRVFFLTPDFSRGRRFSNIILNKIYFAIDKFCTKESDVNICNAKTVIEYKNEIYPSIKSDKYFHMPNVPPPWIVDKYKTIKKISNKIIYVGNLSNDINVDGFKKLFYTISDLKKIIPTIQLVIVGGGAKKDCLVKLAGINLGVRFLGQLTHEETLNQVAESEIGIAIYNGDNAYDEFRDSLKIREYQALGTIPVTTSVVKSNTEEIKKYNSGILVENLNEDSLKNCLQIIFKDTILKDKIKNNAIDNYLCYSSKYFDFINLLQ